MGPADISFDDLIPGHVPKAVAPKDISFDDLIPGGTRSDVLKSIAAAPGKAITGFAGLPGDIASIAGRARSWLADRLVPASVRPQVDAFDSLMGKFAPATNVAHLMPTSAGLRVAAEKVTGEWHEPQTRAGKIADTATQAATTMGRSLVTEPFKALPVVAAITGGTEGAGAATNDNPWARAFGGLLGGGAAALPAALASKPGALVRSSLGEVTKADIEAANARQAMAQSQGVPLMGTESFDKGHQLASAVNASPSGNAVLAPFLAQRPAQTQAAVRTGLLGATGDNGIPQVNAARAQEAASKVIADAEAARSAAVSPFYKAAANESVDPRSMRGVSNEIEGLLYGSPIGSPTEKAVGQWYQQLFPHSPEPTVIPAQTKAKPRMPVGVSADDDIVTAVRKMGGINPNDERIGSLAKGMPFGPDPSGPVWRQPSYGQHGMTTSGHSVDRMAESLYQKGYLNDRNDLDGLIDKLADHHMGHQEHYSMFRQPESQDPLAMAINNLTDQLATKNAPKARAQVIPANAVLPETNVGRLNDLYKNLGIEGDTSAIGATAADKMAAYPAQRVQSALGDVLKQNPNIARGQQLYADITRNEIEPLRAGPVGVVAGKTGYDPSAASPLPRVLSTVADSNSVRPESIKSLYTHLNATDRQAFPGLVQTHIENKLNDALANLRSGPNPTAGAKFYDAIAGTPQDRANFEEMMRGVAQARGKDAEAVVSGAKNLLQTLDLTGRTPGVGSPTATRNQIDQALSGSRTGIVMRSASTRPLSAFADRLDQWVNRGRYTDLAKVLTSPKSVDLLVKMAKLKPSGVTAGYYAATLLGLDKAMP